MRENYPRWQAITLLKGSPVIGNDRHSHSLPKQAFLYYRPLCLMLHYSRAHYRLPEQTTSGWEGHNWGGEALPEISSVIHIMEEAISRIFDGF